MSAIAGVFSPSSIADPQRLERIHQALAHRGNRERTEQAGPACLAYRTWDAKAHPQPLCSNSLRVVADAALYNRDELRRALGEVPAEASDAELIARAYTRWGTECPSRLEGDFAFAVWESKPGHLFCARDPLGIRPFFYRWDGKTLAWASEARALAADPAYAAAPDEPMVAEYVLGWSHFPDTSASFYRDIRQLPGGHFLVVERGELRVQRYWDIEPTDEASRRRSFEENAEEFRALLERAVRQRLGGSERAAVQVSGGLDSTSVASLIEQFKLERNGRGPSTHYVSYYIPHARGDERRFTQAFEEKFGASVDYVELADSQVLEDLDTLPDLGENPFLDLAWKQTARQAAHLRASGRRVVLTGLGGDNIFSDSGPGYFLDLARTRGLLRAVQAYRQTYRYYGVSPGLLLGPTLRRLVPAGVKREVKRWLGRELPAWVRPEFARRSGLLERVRQPLPRRGFPTLTQEEDYRELTSGRVGLMLAYFDRVGAAYGFKFRHSYFDPALVRFTLLAPLEHKVRDGETKVLLRESMRGILPEPVRRRRQKGTAQPFLVESIRRREAARWEEAARSVRLCGEYVEPAEVERQTRRFLAGDDSALRPAWRLLSLELWLQRSFGG
ncbi:MAG: asparagine synthase-related protein [Candidatus Acidiferrales bacterium]